MATFTNQATLTFNGNVTNSNIVTGEITEVLTVTKTALNTCYTNDGELTYIVSLINSGTTPLTGLSTTDNLGAYDFNGTTLLPLRYIDGSVLYFVNGVQQTKPTEAIDNGVIFSGINIPASSNAMLIYRAETTEFAPLETDAAIENTVTVIGDGLVNQVTATSTLSACELARLEITKALSPTVVNDNGEITYTLTILNYGNTPVTTEDTTVVTDTFDPILKPIAVTLNGVALTEPADYTYDTTTGLFTTANGIITVPAATYTRDPVTGAYTATPGTSVLEITGTV